MKIRNILYLLGIGLMSSCSNFLDVIPDNVATIDNAFTDRISAEKFLFTCYSYLPEHSSPNDNPAFVSGDENMIIRGSYFFGDEPFEIARGLQNSNDPYMNFWDGRKRGKSMFMGIRDCNIMLENIHKPADLNDYERIRWVAEVKFLKAYFHFWLFQLYGPIPIMDENLAVSASPDEVKLYRDPVDPVVDYIVDLLDEAAADLPPEIQDRTTEMGRITRPIALAVKAKVLVLAASPLFNGNSDYAGVKDNRGVSLFPESYDAQKWVRAAKACKEAIDVCKEAGHELYYFQTYRKLSDSTVYKMNIRGAVTDRWNREIIWGATSSPLHLQKLSVARLESGKFSIQTVISEMAPTLRIAEQFYTNNGIPIDEDPAWDYQHRYDLETATAQHKYYIQNGYVTAKLHFNREPRFYGSLGFDGCVWYGAGRLDDNNSYYMECKRGQNAGMLGSERYPCTGYLGKKLVHWETSVTTALYATRYSFPIIRLADLYLLYAEALTESENTVNPEVYPYLDDIRKRAGLKGVVESWKLSVYPEKPSTKEGLLDIIRKERLNELALEGQRFWDLRRWKKAEEYMNKPFEGWNVAGETAADFYQVTEQLKSSFGRKNYLWPIRQASLDVNSNLVQNPGW